MTDNENLVTFIVPPSSVHSTLQGGQSAYHSYQTTKPVQIAASNYVHITTWLLFSLITYSQYAVKGIAVSEQLTANGRY